ncbi:hypothetical protein DL93DRAFT_1051929 [Clavulina sp. PMI_390]|nr:hypothetical protein DL93DRAFT_1051929 [Clavulina sp. PMI_390]
MLPLSLAVEIGTHFPSLRRLRYIIRCDDNSVGSNVMDLTRTPHIGALEIRGVGLQLMPYRFAPGWQLRCCRLGGGGVSGLFKMLASTRTTLESLQLDSGTTLANISSITEFPRLRELVLYGHLSQMFVANLLAPSLDLLRFGKLTWIDVPKQSGFPDARIIIFHHLPPKFVREFFQLHPKVQRLCASVWNIQSIVAVWKDIPSEILANLEVLRVVQGLDVLDRNTFRHILAINRRRPHPFVLEIDTLGQSLADIRQEFGPWLRIVGWITISHVYPVVI